MQEIYNSDKPIHLKEQDRFNRYKFSNRVSDTIIKRNVDEGLVIGLYGIWGEGKSSVLNMIEQDLLKSDKILVVKFNPWRFKDEDTLILNFFKNISNALDRELNSQREKVGQLLKKYGSITSIFNIDLSSIGENLSDADIEELKLRVNGFLKDSEKKVVVIIDDIDRLDKGELFALFKLIKLTGDFSNTYYILSFDDEMVAYSIGERYAEGNKESGYNFLEKIIQVPLRLPQALSKDLLKYTFEVLNEILNSNQIDLDEEAQTVGYNISQNILPRIKTPRLAIRYANSLSFLIPLLKGEVNMADLILFEGIKIFYPKHYDFIKRTPEYFIESYNKRFDNGKDGEKVNEFKRKFEEINQELSKNEQKAIVDLLEHLFPLVQEALGNYNYAYGRTNWDREKRIVSAKYFNRYFVYSVPKWDISDVYFDRFIAEIRNKNFETILEEVSEILKNVEPVDFINKISFYEDALDWEQRKILVETICYYQDKFEKMKGGAMFVFHNPNSQAAITIARILSKHNDYDERFKFVQSLLNRDIDSDFSFEILRWLRVGENEEEKSIKSDHIETLEEILLERAIKDCKQSGSNLFQKYSGQIFALLKIWHKKAPKQLKKYIDRCIKDNKNFQEIIIDSFTSTIYSSTNPNPYKVDFKKESFEMLKLYYDVGKLNRIFSKKEYTRIRKEEAKFLDVNEGQTLDNAIRQFLHWYKLDQETSEKNKNEVIE